jgi:hypothetical protein
MTELHNEYIKHDIYGRTYTLADGNHICVNIITSTKTIGGTEINDTIEKVWFMDIGNDQVVYTGQTCDESQIIEQDVSKFPDKLVADVEQQYDVTVRTDISHTDISVPTKTLKVDIPISELKNKSERKLAENLYFPDVKPTDGCFRINKYSNDSYGYTLEDTTTRRKMTISKYKHTVKIQIFDSEGTAIHTDDANKYKPSEVAGVLDDYKTFLQL